MLAPCPVTSRQLVAYELRREGRTSAEAGRILGIAPRSYHGLLTNGRRRMGIASVAEAERILVDGGWLDPATGLPPLVRNYIRAFEAYLDAPKHARDELLVRELTTAALNDLLADR